MAAECALVLLMTEGFAAGAKAFNDFSPERDEVSAVRICVNGMDMSQAEYEETEDPPRLPDRHGIAVSRLSSHNKLSQSYTPMPFHQLRRRPELWK